MTPAKKAGPKPGKRKGGARSLARLLAVQALYLIRMTPGATAKKVVRDMARLNMGKGEGVPLITEVDQEFFADLVNGASERRGEIKKHLEAALTGKWNYQRLEAILAAILEAGAYELMARPDVPKAVVIDEYVEIAHDFYGGGEPAFVNGILEQLAKTLRA